MAVRVACGPRAARGMRRARYRQEPKGQFVRHNHQPPIAVSSLPVHHVSLWPGEKPQVVCPSCGRWRMLYRGMLAPHHMDLGDRRRCPGSGQRVRVDLDPLDWLAQLRIAELDAGTRTGRWTARRITATGTSGRKFVQRIARPPVPAPTFRIVASTR